MPDKYIPTVLSIAGSDPYGGAGIQVDAKTIHALGCYAFTVITSLTAQNSTGVKSVSVTPKNIFKAQLEAILDDINVDAVKIGMLGNSEIISVIVEAIDKYKLKNIVLDTVFVSSSGAVLLEEDAVDLMVKELFPRVTLITPNLLEVNEILSQNYVEIGDEIQNISEGFKSLSAKSVLIKGGHSQDEKYATDYLADNALKIEPFSTRRVQTSHTHGTGCVLSSAIAVGFAKGEGMAISVKNAKVFLYTKLQASSSLKIKYKVENDTRKEPLF
jgi:hydroxymethylpyrimidine/phosphomethylpyrimidine kinase